MNYGSNKPLNWCWDDFNKSQFIKNRFEKEESITHVQQRNICLRKSAPLTRRGAVHGFLPVLRPPMTKRLSPSLLLHIPDQNVEKGLNPQQRKQQSYNPFLQQQPELNSARMPGLPFNSETPMPGMPQGTISPPDQNKPQLPVTEPTLNPVLATMSEQSVPPPALSPLSMPGNVPAERSANVIPVLSNTEAPPTHGGFQNTPVQPSNGPVGRESKPDPFDMNSEDFSIEQDIEDDVIQDQNKNQSSQNKFPWLKAMMNAMTPMSPKKPVTLPVNTSGVIKTSHEDDKEDYDKSLIDIL